MEKKTKVKYNAPTIQVERIDLEEGIAAQSANAIPRGVGANTPDVEDWVDGGSVGEGKFEL